MKYQYYKSVSDLYVDEFENKKEDFAKIEVYYSKGGINYLSGERVQRGIFVSFNRTVKTYRDDYAVESFEPFNNVNFRVFVKALGRKSAKQIQEVYEKVGQIKEDLFAQYADGNKQIVYQLVTS